MSFDPVVDEGAPGSARGGRARPGRALTSALLSVLAAVLVGACGTAPQRSADTAATSPSAVSKPGPRGGGYYKDDGPAEELPDGLDELADAEPRIEPLHRFANRPYVVFGKEYIPVSENYRQAFFDFLAEHSLLF